MNTTRPTIESRQRGISHGQILRLLDRHERHLIYVVPPGHSAGYYLAIVCQPLWGREGLRYRVDHARRSVVFQSLPGPGEQHLAFKEFRPEYVTGDAPAGAMVRNEEGRVYIEFDHRCDDAILEVDPTRKRRVW